MTLNRSLPLEKIKPFNTALLVIDMQRDFVEPGAPGETPGAREMIPVVNSLLGWAREHRLPAIFSQEMHRPDRSDYGIELEYDPLHCHEGTPGPDLCPELAIRPGDYRITKRRYDAFLGTDLDLLLRSKRIENLVCCGVSTDVCVMNTVLTARNLDYRVLLPSDAMRGSSPELHEAALLCMSTVFAYRTEVSALMELWKDPKATR